MVKTVGFVGFGPMNVVLARFSIDAGYKVVISNSRGPNTLADAVADLGENASAATTEDVPKKSDIVVISIPLHVIHSLPRDMFDNKILIDTMNYYPERNGKIDEIHSRALTCSEYVQRYFEKSKVIKAFYSIDCHHLKTGPRPPGDPDRWALPVAGDDEDAKKEVLTFTSYVGYDGVDCGSLADSWKIQQATPVYALPYCGTPPEGMSKDERRIWYRSDRSQVVGVGDVLRLVGQAKKSDPAEAYFYELPSGLMD
jgi:predicted dinucleotide-binding enzyme